MRGCGGALERAPSTPQNAPPTMGAATRANPSVDGICRGPWRLVVGGGNVDKCVQGGFGEFGRRGVWAGFPAGGCIVRPTSARRARR